MCIMNVAQTISPGVYSKMGFDPVKKFSHITLMALVPSLLLVHPRCAYRKGVHRTA